MSTEQGRKIASLLLRGGACIGFAAFGAGGARAQDSAPPNRGDATSASLNDRSDETAIIVTARKRRENIKDVPISITEVSADEIIQRGVGDFRQLDGVVPNMVQTGLESNVTPTISIRGIGSDARNIGFESGVSVYVDGVYTGRPHSWMSELPDVERIEVLRGPQGTLFGKNTIAGAVNIILRKPSADVHASGELEYGNYNLFRGRGSVSGPLSDTIFAGLTLFGTRRDGIQTNLFDGRHYWNRNDWGGRLQLRFVPSGDIDILAEADKLHERIRLNLNTTVSGPGSTAANGPRFVNINETPYAQRDIYGGNLNIDLKLPNGATLTSITAQRFNNIEFVSDDDGSPAAMLRSHFRDEETQFTEELRYTSPGASRLRYVLGLYFLNQQVVTNRLSTAPAGGFAPVTLTIGLQGTVKANDYAAFGSADFDVTRNLTVTAGLRYTHIDKSVFANLQGLAPFGIISFTNHVEKISNDALSPTLSLVYKVTPSLNAYATISRGFKGGGFNVDYVSNPHLAFNPEFVTNYEGGLKLVTLRGRLRANVAVYRMAYKDLQVSVVSPIGGFIIANAAQATIKGGELDVSVEPVTGLTLTEGLGYNEANFDQFGTNTGNRLAFAPRWTASSAVQYRLAVGSGSLSLRGEHLYRSSYYSDVSNSANRFIHGYGLLNARITYATREERLQVQLWVENITDKLYINDRGAPLGGLLGSQSVVYGKPRTYGVRVIGKF